MRQVVFSLILFVFSSVANANESFFEPNEEELKESWCKPGDFGTSYFEWGNLETLVEPYLSITTWDEDFGKSAENLGLAVNITKNEKVGLSLFKKFEKAVMEAEGFKGLKYDASIESEYYKQYETCKPVIFSSTDDYYSKAQICRAKTKNIIQTIYGQRLAKVQCNARLKGEEFPVLVFTTCSIEFWPNSNSVDKFRRLKFLDYISPEVGEKAMERLLQKYANNISKIVSMGKKCG